MIDTTISVISNAVRTDINVFKRGRVMFYYITDSTNKVTVPSGKSPIWTAIYNSYLHQSFSQQLAANTGLYTTPTIIDHNPIDSSSKVRTRKRKSTEIDTSTNYNKTTSIEHGKENPLK